MNLYRNSNYYTFTIAAINDHVTAALHLEVGYDLAQQTLRANMRWVHNERLKMRSETKEHNYVMNRKIF
jgi:hypothetical protein